MGEAAMQTSNTADPLWDMDQLSAYLKVPKRTLYRWRTENYGPRGFRLGRHVRYPQSEVMEWIRQMEQNEGVVSTTTGPSGRKQLK
jgi:excisionase family DNA binding protein